jgi:PD-(D/E)XK nuclease superfamily
MIEFEGSSTEADKEALKTLQADAAELERIGSLVNRFNIFEAIGFVHQEVMHSRFLAFLLDPKQNHGLGDLFLKRFLQKVSESSNRVSLSQALDSVDARDLAQTTVHTEVYTGDGRIDFLLLNEIGKWAMIVENKIWTTEHSDQLDRYCRFVKKKYPGWQVFGIYLTPLGDAPLHTAYDPLGYAAVCDLLDSVVNDQGSSLNVNVQVAIKHYTDMVRRNIVGDSEATRLAHEIYEKHQQALDFIYEHRSGAQGAIRDLVVRLIRNTKGLTYKGTYKNDLIFFRPQEWDNVPAFNEGPAKHGFFRFVFHNNRFDGLALFLETTPGDREIRRRLFNMGQKDESLFNYLEDPGTDDWPKLYCRTFLTPERYEGSSDGDLGQEIRRQWNAFLAKDLPRIDAALKKESWIWKPVETEGPA